MGVLYVPLISCKIFINDTKISGGIMRGELLSIKEIDKKMNSIEEYYNNFNMMSYEYDLKDKMYLSRLYKLKLKLLEKQKKENEGE